MVDSDRQQLVHERFGCLAGDRQPSGGSRQLNGKCHERRECQHERADLGRSFAPFDAIVMQGAIHLTPFLEGWVYIIITFML